MYRWFALTLLAVVACGGCRACSNCSDYASPLARTPYGNRQPTYYEDDGSGVYDAAPASPGGANGFPTTSPTADFAAP